MPKQRDLITILADHEAAIRQMRATLARIGSVDPEHDDLVGLGDDDHTQYLNLARHDADDHSALTIVEAQITDLDAYLPLAGGTMAGNVNLASFDLTNIGNGYLYGTTVYFTSSGTFTKADYPGLRAVKIMCQGGGGAGAGAAATTTNGSWTTGGGAGGYAESFVLVADISTGEAVTVGAAGAGVSGDGGGGGGDTIFDTISGEVRGVGGNGGTAMTAGTSVSQLLASAGGSGSGDLVIPGEYGDPAARYSGTSSDGLLSGGGKSHWGSAGRGRLNANGDAASGFGGGGGGSANNQSQAVRTGGAGTIGLVRVELYY